MRNNPREDLLNCHRRHVRAWEQKNLDQLRELYAEDAVIFNTEPPAQFLSFRTFENTLNQHFSHIGEMSIFTSNIRIEVNGVLAWISSQFLREYRLPGRTIRQNGRWTEVYIKGEDDWKVVHLHASLDPIGEEI
jgi:ketosteroid isomerase-like protein